MTLGTLIAAILLNKTVCMPSVDVGSNAAYNALYAVQLCWDNEPGLKGQTNALIVEWMASFD